jgi:hypothetical protein
LLLLFFEIVDHGGRRGDMGRALTQWRHLVASHEATDVLHGAMRPASHRRIRMAIEKNLFDVCFSSSSIFLFDTTIS